MDAAREAIKDNRVPSKAGLRFWQLSGGILRCGLCGRSMTTRSINARAGTYHHHYYHCPAHHQHGDAGCTNRKYFRAENIEGPVWEMVAGLLRDPERLRAGLDELIEAERAGLRGDPEAEAVAWLDRLTALERKRSRLQDMAAEGHITLDELGAKLRGLEEERKTAERELDTLKLRRTLLEELERDKASLLTKYADMVPEALENLSGEERHQVYRMLRLQVWVRPDGPIEVEGVLREAVCTPTDTPWSTRGRTGGCSSR